jgi:phage portal protein BeeE
MIGDLEHATFSNIESQSLDFVRFSLMPWLRRIELACRRCLFTDEQRKAGLLAKFDPTEMMRGDSAARTNYYARGIAAGWLTRNEAREMEDLNPLDGLDDPLRPLNMVSNDDAESLAEASTATTVPGAPTADPTAPQKPPTKPKAPPK